MPRKVVTLLAARARAWEREQQRARREESEDPVVAKQAAALARGRQQRRARRQEGNRLAAEHARWLDQATADLFAWLDERRTAPGAEAELGFRRGLVGACG